MSSSPYFIVPPRTQQGTPLSELEIGQSGRIELIDEPELEMALLKMGIAPGDPVIFTGAAPWGGPIAIRATHTKLSMRREDATHVWIKRE